MNEDDDRPRRKITHDVGQKLDELSVHELDERIALLQAEIGRLESARQAKQQARDTAGSIFKTAG